MNIRDSPVAKQLPYRKTRARGKGANPNDVGDLPPQRVSGGIAAVFFCSISYSKVEYLKNTCKLLFEK